MENTSATPPAKADDGLYRCGTLTYTRRGLVFLFAWLLWGDLCFTLMESVVPSILPLKLKALGSANWLIGLIMTTLPGIFNTTICPWVSFKSDRYRSKWGRRIPFIIYTMPFLTASLILIGFSEPIGIWLHRIFLSGTGVSKTAVIIFSLAVFAGLFDLFNMFVGSVYSYLFNDTVPEKYLAPFMAYFRLVGTLTSAIYSYFIFRFALSHMTEIYVGAALLYFVGFGLMCFKVKESDYPPPSDAGLKPSLMRDIRTFGRECYTLPFYWQVFLYMTFLGVAGTIGTFGVFFSQSMGLSLDQIGKIGAVSGIAISICLPLAGHLAQRWHPVRTEMYFGCFNAVFAVASLVWVFADPPPPMIYFGVCICNVLCIALGTAMHQASGMPRLMILLPRDRFGQFCGAMALVRAAGTMCAGVLAGLFLDFIRRFYETGSLVPYRYMYFWVTLWSLAAMYCSYLSYRAWKRLGGETDYKPPLAPFRLRDLPPAKQTGVVTGLLMVTMITFAGLLGVALFLTGHAYLVTHNTYNVGVFSAYAAVLLVLLGLYLRYLRFAERP